MHIRTFRAANLQQALQRIREQMGPDASILHTRKVAGGTLRFWDRGQVEVTAGLRHRHLETLVDPPLHDEPPSEPPARTVQRDHDRVAVLDRLIFAGPMPLPRGMRQIVALAGGAGVGKTTTMAKLAAGLHLSREASVGILSIQGVRAAERQQVEAYAQAMGVPLVCVPMTDQVGRGEDLLPDCEVIFVDCPGLSRQNPAAIEELHRRLQQLGVDQVHLLLDASASRAAIAATCASFAPLAAGQVILSKVDESVEPWELLTTIAEQGLRISYVTTGQHVPGDLLVASRAWVQNWTSALAPEPQSTVMSTPQTNPSEGEDGRSRKTIPARRKILNPLPTSSR